MRSDINSPEALLKFINVQAVIVDGVEFTNIETRYSLIGSPQDAPNTGFGSLTVRNCLAENVINQEGGDQESLILSHFSASHFEGLTFKSCHAPGLFTGNHADATDGVIVQNCHLDDFEISKSSSGRLFEKFWSGSLIVRSCSFNNAHLLFDNVYSLYFEACTFTGGNHAETAVHVKSLLSGSLVLAGCQFNGYTSKALNIGGGDACNVTICKSTFKGFAQALYAFNKVVQVIVQDSYFESSAANQWLYSQAAGYFALQNSVFKAEAGEGSLVVAEKVKLLVVVGNKFTVPRARALAVTGDYLEGGKIWDSGDDQFGVTDLGEYVVQGSWEDCLTSWWTLYPDPATVAQSAPAAPPQTEVPLPAQTEVPLPEQTEKPPPPPPAQTEVPLPEQTEKPPPPPAQTEEPLPEQTKKPPPAQTEEPLPEQTKKPPPAQTEEPLPDQTEKPATVPIQVPDQGSNLNNNNDQGLGSGAKAGIGAAAAAAAVAAAAGIAFFVLRRRKGAMDEVGPEPEDASKDDPACVTEIEDDGRYVSEYGLSDGEHD
jgi:hypothetical protein